MDKAELNVDPEGNEIRMLQLFQRLQKFDLGKLPQKDVDLTLSQMQVISFVGEHPSCHLQDLAEGLGVSSPTASVSIRRLEEIGLIARQPDPEDGRATCLMLTRKSQTAFSQMKKQMFLRMQWFLNHLTPEEQDQLLELMEKAVSGIELSANQT